MKSINKILKNVGLKQEEIKLLGITILEDAGEQVKIEITNMRDGFYTCRYVNKTDLISLNLEIEKTKGENYDGKITSRNISYSK